jgi:hypothetical protein
MDGFASAEDSMPQYAFDRCDGDHEMVDFLPKVSTIADAESLGRRSYFACEEHSA